MKSVLLRQEWRFSAKGYQITIEPFGLSVMSTSQGHRRRGLLLTAISEGTGSHHTLSLASDINQDGHNVTLLVDGELREETTGGTLFKLPQDLAAAVEPVIDWFIDRHLS